MIKYILLNIILFNCVQITYQQLDFTGNVFYQDTRSGPGFSRNEPAFRNFQYEGHTVNIGIEHHFVFFSRLNTWSQFRYEYPTPGGDYIPEVFSVQQVIPGTPFIIQDSQDFYKEFCNWSGKPVCCCFNQAINGDVGRSSYSFSNKYTRNSHWVVFAAKTDDQAPPKDTVANADSRIYVVFTFEYGSFTPVIQTIVGFDFDQDFTNTYSLYLLHHTGSSKILIVCEKQDKAVSYRHLYFQSVTVTDNINGTFVRDHPLTCIALKTVHNAQPRWPFIIFYNGSPVLIYREFQGGNNDIIYQLINEDGTLNGPEILLISIPGADFYHFQIDTDEYDHLFLLWHDLNDLNIRIFDTALNQICSHVVNMAYSTTEHSYSFEIYDFQLFVVYIIKQGSVGVKGFYINIQNDQTCTVSTETILDVPGQGFINMNAYISTLDIDFMDGLSIATPKVNMFLMYTYENPLGPLAYRLTILEMECHHVCSPGNCIRATKFGCTACKVEANRNPDTNLGCICNNGYYDDFQTSNCELCHPQCLTCTYSTPLFCTSCDPANFRVLVGKECQCMTNLVTDPNNIGVCGCDAKCNGCVTSFSNCLLCTGINRDPPNCNCSTGYAEDVNLICQVIVQTDPQCYLNRSPPCTDCNGSVLNTVDNLCECDFSFYFQSVTPLVCMPCQILNCKFCNPPDGLICTECLDPNRVPENCVDCIEGYKLKNNQCVVNVQNKDDNIFVQLAQGVKYLSIFITLLVLPFAFFSRMYLLLALIDFTQILNCIMYINVEHPNTFLILLQALGTFKFPYFFNLWELLQIHEGENDRPYMLELSPYKFHDEKYYSDDDLLDDQVSAYFLETTGRCFFFLLVPFFFHEVTYGAYIEIYFMDYLNIILATCTAYYGFSNKSDIYQYLMDISVCITFLLMIIYPFFSIFKIKKYLKSRKIYFKQVYGTMINWHGREQKRTTPSYYYKSVLLIRKLSFILLLVFMHDYTYLQLVLMDVLSILMTIFLIFSKSDTKTATFLNILSELMLIFVQTFIIFDCEPKGDCKSNGQLQFLVCFTVILLHIIHLFYQTLKLIIHYFKSTKIKGYREYNKRRPNLVVDEYDSKKRNIVLTKLHLSNVKDLFENVIKDPQEEQQILKQLQEMKPKKFSDKKWDKLNKIKLSKSTNLGKEIDIYHSVKGPQQQDPNLQNSQPKNKLIHSVQQSEQTNNNSQQSESSSDMGSDASDSVSVQDTYQHNDSQSLQIQSVQLGQTQKNNNQNEVQGLNLNLDMNNNTQNMNYLINTNVTDLHTPVSSKYNGAGGVKSSKFKPIMEAKSVYINSGNASTYLKNNEQESNNNDKFNFNFQNIPAANGSSGSAGIQTSNNQSPQIKSSSGRLRKSKSKLNAKKSQFNLNSPTQNNNNNNTNSINNLEQREDYNIAQQLIGSQFKVQLGQSINNNQNNFQIKSTQSLSKHNLLSENDLDNNNNEYNNDEENVQKVEISQSRIDEMYQKNNNQSQQSISSPQYTEKDLFTAAKKVTNMQRVKSQLRKKSQHKQEKE